MIGSKCNAPGFKITSSAAYAEDYEIHWVEWDLSMMDGQPSKTLAASDTALTSDMNLVDAYPRLDQAFAYEGVGSDHDYGFPGHSTSHTCGWNIACFLGYPRTTE